jgi:hypothetical protein
MYRQAAYSRMEAVCRLLTKCRVSASQPSYGEASATVRSSARRRGDNFSRRASVITWREVAVASGNGPIDELEEYAGVTLDSGSVSGVAADNGRCSYLMASWR